MPLSFIFKCVLHQKTGQYRKMRKVGKSNRLCKTEGVSWTYDTPSVFYPFFKILRSLSYVFCDNVLAVEYASSSQRDNYPSTRLSGLEML